MFKLPATIQRHWHFNLKSEKVMFSPNLHQVVANYSPGLPNVRQLLATVWQVISQKTETGKKLGEICQLIAELGEQFTSNWGVFGEHLPIIQNIRHLFIKQLPNSLQFTDWSPRWPISRQFFAKWSQNNHVFITNCRYFFVNKNSPTARIHRRLWDPRLHNHVPNYWIRIIWKI